MAVEAMAIETILGARPASASAILRPFVPEGNTDRGWSGASPGNFHVAFHQQDKLETTTNVLLETLDVDINILTVILHSCGVSITFSTLPEIPEGFSHWLTQLECLPMLDFTQEDLCTIAQMKDITNHIVQILGGLTGVRHMVKLTAEKPNTMRHRVPYLVSALKSFKQYVLHIHQTFIRKKDAWMSIKKRTSADHKAVASEMVRSFLENAARTFIEDMCENDFGFHCPPGLPARSFGLESPPDLSSGKSKRNRKHRARNDKNI